MPEGTKVDKVYKALLKSGFNKSSAAKIAQKKTGEALKTGKPSIEKNDMSITAGMDVPGLVTKYPPDKNCMKCQKEPCICVKKYMKDANGADHAPAGDEKGGQFVSQGGDGGGGDGGSDKPKKTSKSKIKRTKEEIQLDISVVEKKFDDYFNEMKAKYPGDSWMSIFPEVNKKYEEKKEQIKKLEKELKASTKDERAADKAKAEAEKVKKVEKLKSKPLDAEELKHWNRTKDAWKKQIADDDFTQWIDAQTPTRVDEKGKEREPGNILNSMATSYYRMRANTDHAVVTARDKKMNDEAEKKFSQRGDKPARDFIIEGLKGSDYDKPENYKSFAKIMDAFSDEVAEDIANRFIGFTGGKQKGAGLAIGGGIDKDGYTFGKIYLSEDSSDNGGFFTVLAHELGHIIDPSKAGTAKKVKGKYVETRKYSTSDEWKKIWEEEIDKYEEIEIDPEEAENVPYYRHIKYALTQYAAVGNLDYDPAIEGFAELIMAAVTGKCDGRLENAPDFDPKKYPKAMKYLKDNKILRNI